MDAIDIRTLDWKPNPHDYYAATADVPAGDRRLRLDAALSPEYVQFEDPAPRTGILDALREGRDLDRMLAHAVPLDAEGNVFVHYAINSGHEPSVRLDTSSVEAANTKLYDLVRKTADPVGPIYSAVVARRLERQAEADERRQEAGRLRY